MSNADEITLDDFINEALDEPEIFQFARVLRDEQERDPVAVPLQRTPAEWRAALEVFLGILAAGRALKQRYPWLNDNVLE